MGATLSPVKCAIAISEYERRGWSNSKAAMEAGYLKRGESVASVINGKRIADDVTVASKLLCSRCVCEFLEKVVYKAPLAIEVEEIGRTIGVADLELSVVDDGRGGDEFLDFYQRDKNQDYVLGLASAPKRIRWEPWLGYQTVRQVQQWLVGRYHDVVAKNAFALMKEARQTAGVVEATAEMVLLRYPRSMLVRALKSIRTPSLARWIKVALEWVQTKVVYPVVEKQVQDAAWKTRVTLGLC